MEGVKPLFQIINMHAEKLIQKTLTTGAIRYKIKMDLQAGKAED